MNVKKVLMIIGAVLIVFYVIRQPGPAAQTVKDLLGWLEEGAEAIITFVQNVFA